MLRINIAGDFVVPPVYSDKYKDDQIVMIDREIKKVFTSQSLNIINLEAPVIKNETPAKKFGPVLKMNFNSLEILDLLNVKLVTLANNHVMDHGHEGLRSTFSSLSDKKISYVGAGYNVMEAAKPFIYERDDIKVGILNFAENEFSNTYGDTPGASPLDVIENTCQIQNLKNKVDKVIVIVHGGAEMHQYPSPRFKKLLEYFAVQGADAVIAHHTHRYNGYRVFNNVPIVYGTGNFAFPKSTSELNSDFLWNLGVICCLQVEKNKPTVLNVKPVICNSGTKLHIRSLNSEEKSKYLELDKKITEVIYTDEKVESEFLQYVYSVEKKYVHFMQPYTSKYLHKLFSLRILPNFLQVEKKRLLYLNLLRCEAHRDVLLKILDK